MQYKQLKEKSPHQSNMNISYQALRAIYVSGACCFAMIVSSCNGQSGTSQKGADSTKTATTASKDPSIVTQPEPAGGPLDTALYNKKMAQFANGDSSGR